MVVYKVVTTREEQLCSAIACDYPEWNVVYRPQEPVQAKIGLLFAFETLDAALKFRGLHDDQEVWECHAEVIEHSPDISDWESPSFWKDFWNGEKTWADSSPRRTVGCSEITLLRRIDE